MGDDADPPPGSPATGVWRGLFGHRKRLIGSPARIDLSLESWRRAVSGAKSGRAPRGGMIDHYILNGHQPVEEADLIRWAQTPDCDVEHTRAAMSDTCVLDGGRVFGDVSPGGAVRRSAGRLRCRAGCLLAYSQNSPKRPAVAVRPPATRRPQTREQMARWRAARPPLEPPSP